MTLPSGTERDLCVDAHLQGGSSRGLSALGTVKLPKSLYLLPYFTVPRMAQGQWLDAGTPSGLESGFSTL